MFGYTMLHVELSYNVRVRNVAKKCSRECQIYLAFCLCTEEKEVASIQLSNFGQYKQK
jgi:hypothetical protein